MLKALSVLGLAALAIGVSACGGGSGSTSNPIPTPVPTMKASASPTSSASPTPTSSPTLAPASGKRAVAVTLTTANGQKVVSAVARKALDGTLAGTVAEFPSVIESLGDFNLNTSINVWEYDTTTGDPVADGAPTITPANTSDTSVLDVIPVMATGFTDAYQAGVSALAVSQTSENVAFANATASVPVEIYDGFDLRCNGQLQYTGYAFTAGVISHTTTSVGADFYMDCSVPGQISIDFPYGGVVADAPVTDAYGSTASQFSTVLTAPTVSSTTLFTLTNAATQNGEIVAFNTGEGRVAKLMFQNMANDDPAAQGLFGFVMEASASGTFAY